MKATPSSVTGRPRLHFPSKRGFALIITISILVLLALVSVGLLSLSTITVRSANHSAALQEARTNARLALMVALGELQKHAGPDQRVTTNGSFSGGTPGNYGRDPENVPNPWFTGVWKREDADQPFEDMNLDPNKPGYEPQPVDDEVAWLVSGNEGREPGSTGYTTPDSNIPDPNPSTNNPQSVWMLRRYLESADLDPAEVDRLSVKVPLVATETGAYGYWVADQSL